MSTQKNYQLVKDFIASLSTGTVPDELLTPDMTMWTISSGESADKERFKGGIKLFAAVANHSIVYEILSLTAEEDRVVAEVKSSGTLTNGEDYKNNHVFICRIHDGRIAEVAEYMNPIVIREKVAPLMQEAMAKASK